MAARNDIKGGEIASPHGLQLAVVTVDDPNEKILPITLTLQIGTDLLYMPAAIK